jgi:Zn-dependent alcohol dehydrogenase
MWHRGLETEEKGWGLQTGTGTVMNSLEVPAGKSIAIFGTGAIRMGVKVASMKKILVREQRLPR